MRPFANLSIRHVTDGVTNRLRASHYSQTLMVKCTDHGRSKLHLPSQLTHHLGTSTRWYQLRFRHGVGFTWAPKLPTPIASHDMRQKEEAEEEGFDKLSM